MLAHSARGRLIPPNTSTYRYYSLAPVLTSSNREAQIVKEVLEQQLVVYDELFVGERADIRFCFWNFNQNKIGNAPKFDFDI